MSANTPQIPDGGDWSLYPYGTPSRVAASIFYIFFFISLVMHSVQLFRFGFARYSALLPWACLVYVAGFVMREVSSFHTQNIPQFIATTALLYAAPPVYAAVNYLVLGRLLHYIPSKSPLHPGRVVTTYLGLDVLVEVLTGQGGWRIANYGDAHSVRLGRTLIETSLVLQAVLYVSFMVLQTVVLRRCNRDGLRSDRVKYVQRILYVSTSLVLLRSVYRIIDAFLGGSGYTETHEWCIYVFDALPMLLNSFMLNIFHPSLFLPPSSKIYLSKDGVTERMGPGWTDKRPFLATLFDPFDIHGIITKRDHRNRFWEEEEQHTAIVLEPSVEKTHATSWHWPTIKTSRFREIKMMYANRKATQEWLKQQSHSKASCA